MSNPKHAHPWTEMRLYNDFVIGHFQRINHTTAPTGRRVQR